MSEALRRVREDATAWRNHVTAITQKEYGPQATYDNDNDELCAAAWRRHIDPSPKTDNNDEDDDEYYSIDHWIRIYTPYIVRGLKILGVCVFIGVLLYDIRRTRQPTNAERIAALEARLASINT